MTPRPAHRRSNPLAGWSAVVVFVLVGGALLATVASTRATMTGAIAAVGRGEAIAVEQSVLTDLRELGDADPTPADLQEILGERGGEGLRFIAAFRGRELAGTAGAAVLAEDDDVPDPPAAGAERTLEERRGRIRLVVRAPRRSRARAARGYRYVIEVEPTRAHELAAAAARTLWIGGLAALALIGVAIALSVRETRARREAAKREQADRLASLGAMSAVLAHEIKNPLASLKGNAQLLAQMLPRVPVDGEPDPKGDKLRAKAARVVDEAQRLEQLVVDLLAFVRLGTIARADVDPAELARAAAATVIGADDAGAIAIASEAAPATWSLDGARMREVLVNLLDNARAAGPPVTCRVARADDRLVFEIADRGPGVPAADRATIFEPFVTTKTQGTGLGLAVARRIVELHGGTIEVRDRPDGEAGAVFAIAIPR